MKTVPSKESEVADYKGCAILIYSDDRKFLDCYRAVFSSLGFTPITATTPEAATAILRLMIVTFVVADAEEGLEKCRRVMQRARKMQHHAPVVVVSRKLNQYFRRQAEALGAADYLRHPVSPDEMVLMLLRCNEVIRKPVQSSP